MPLIPISDLFGLFQSFCSGTYGGHACTRDPFFVAGPGVAEA